MRKKDTLTIVVVVVVSALLSFFLSNKLFESPKDRQQSVEVVDPISPEFSRPDAKYFNKDSIDPTQTIQIGDTSNNQPFKDIIPH